MKRKLRDLIKRIIKKRWQSMMKKSEINKIKKRNTILSKITLTETETNEIQNYFKTYYGENISTNWHRLYQSYTGNFDKKYFPEILFSTYLEPLLCDRTISKQMADKAMVELLYRGIDDLYIPKTVVLNCSGIYYDGSRNIIDEKKARILLANCGKKVIKKTINSSSGRGIMIIDLADSYDQKNNMSLDKLLDIFKENFIVQELVKNREDIAKIYSKSLNTFRVITYIVDGKLYHVPLTMRIGQGGNEVDNIHAGGMFIGISDNGELCDKAFTEYQNVYEKHPDSKIKFKGYKLSGIDKMIQIAYKCHGRTPHIKMIFWDFTIDDHNRIVLIEVNLNGQSIWFPQMGNGKSAFGDNTEYMLKLIAKK